MEKNEFLGTEPVGKLLFKLALPAVTAQIINMLYNIIDRIYIGHMPVNGSLALTGVGVCLPIIMIISAFAAFISMGGAPRASIEMGKGNKTEAEKILGSCFTTQIIISVILTIILHIFGESLLMMFGASENTISYAIQYLSIYSLGTVFVQLTLGMNAFINAQGFTRIGMATVLIGAICNIVFDPIFIYVLDFGVRGAAIATILSQAISTTWILHFLRSDQAVLNIKKEYLIPDLKIILSCMALGIAPFIMQASESIINICFNSSLLTYGGDIAVGSMTICTSVMQFALLPLQGLAQGAQPISSYNFGSKNAKRVKQTFLYLLICSVTYSCIFCALIIISPESFVRLFNQEDTALIAFATHALRIYCIGLAPMGAQMACQMTFISTGNAKSSIFVAMLRKFILLIPLIYLLPLIFENKTDAIFIADPIATVISATFTSILFYIQFKAALQQMKRQTQNLVRS